MTGRRSPSLRAAVRDYPDKTLGELYQQSRLAFDEVASRNFPRWVVTFSGGKDSTLTALLAVDYLAGIKRPPRLDVVYSDTLLEIPAMRAAAQQMLEYLRTLADRTGLPIHVHVVQPGLEDTYWVRMLGRGYPPPKPKFRWCTRRLKIEPAAPLISSGDPTAVLTGVRYGESAGRTARLHATCATGGECGQDYWASRGPRGSGVTYFAPIVHWPTCKVWDFLHLVAPQSGWPTGSIYQLYGDSSLRFGCWTCTLVRRDKTVETLIQRDPESNLRLLLGFREQMWSESLDPKNREVRNGHLAALTRPFRENLLARLLDLQTMTSLPLISTDEVAEIRRLWEEGSSTPLPQQLPSISSDADGTTPIPNWI